MNLNQANGNLQLEDSGLPLSKGYIALQESHPTEFRNIEIPDLK